MNAKMKPVSVQNFERTSSRAYDNSREASGRFDCYSRYDLEWIEFLVDSRNRKDQTQSAAAEPELLPNVWNIPRR